MDSYLHKLKEMKNNNFSQNKGAKKKVFFFVKISVLSRCKLKKLPSNNLL